jgi:single-strand DNA-binding protein
VYEVQAENFANSITKGTRVVVTGTQTQRKYTDKDGNERTAYSIRVDEVATSLKWATVEVTKNPKKGESGEVSAPRQASSASARPAATEFFDTEPF